MQNNIKTTAMKYLSSTKLSGDVTEKKSDYVIENGAH